MQSFDDMHVRFRDDSHSNRYMVLSERLMLPTRYPDHPCLDALGLEASIRYLCYQLQWDEYVEAMNVTYQNLTLEFLSSLIHETNHGRGFRIGLITFRLFG